MSDSTQPQWPPREGKQFFLLWAAGILAEAGLRQAVTFASEMAATGAALGGSDANVVHAVFALALTGWEAWLIFPRGWRMIAWALLPLPIFAWTSIFMSSPTLLTVRVFLPIVYLGVILGQCLLLTGVRRRAVLWSIAPVGELFFR